MRISNKFWEGVMPLPSVAEYRPLPSAYPHFLQAVIQEERNK